MGGVRIGGFATPPVLYGPPFSLQEGTVAPTDADQVNVWIVREGGTNIRLTPYTDPTCTSPPCGSEMHTPRLNPDGNKVAFFDFDPDDFGMSLYVVPVDGSATYPLSPSFRFWDDGGQGFWANDPAWSSDGSKILFVTASPSGSYQGGTLGGRIVSVTYPGASATELWVPDVQSPTQYEEAFRPTYSPDGTKIAFFVNIAPAGTGATLSRQGLWVMDADGSSPTNIDNWASSSTNQGYLLSGTQLAWSNDSQWIAYVDRGFGGGGTFSLYKIQPDGTNKTLLDTGSAGTIPHHVGWGAWLDDDSKVIFTTKPAASASGDWRIHTVNADGTGDTEIVGAADGPVGNQNFETCYRLRDRIYWVYTKSPTSPSTLRSCALDGTDIQTYFSQGDGTFDDGQAFEWL